MIRAPLRSTLSHYATLLRYGSGSGDDSQSENGSRLLMNESFGIFGMTAARPVPPDDYDPVRDQNQSPDFTAELVGRSEEHTSELESHHDLVCRLLLEKKKKR